MWYNFSMKEAAVITENNEVAKIPPVESSLLPLSPTVVAVAADQNVSAEIVNEAPLDELVLLPKSMEDVQNNYMWKYFALYPFPRQEDVHQMENSAANKTGVVSIIRYAANYLPKGWYARYIFDWIFNQGCRAAQNSDSDEIVIKLPSDPFEMFREVTGYTGKRGANARKQLIDFLEQLDRMSSTGFIVKIKKEGSKGFSTCSCRVIDSMSGWADGLSDIKAAPIKNDRGRPSRQFIIARNEPKNQIVLAQEFVKRVIRKNGSHSKRFPIDSNFVRGMTMIERDVAHSLWHLLWQASKSQTNEVQESWSYFTDDLYGHYISKEAKKGHDGKVKYLKSQKSVPIPGNVLRKRKNTMKEIIAKFVEKYNYWYQNMIGFRPIDCRFEDKFVCIIGGPPINALNYQSSKQQIKD